MSTLNNLNAKLFDQLDRLAVADKSDLDKEIARAQSMSEIGKQIIDAHRTQIDAVKIVAQYKGLNPNQVAPQISVGDMNLEV